MNANHFAAVACNEIFGIGDTEVSSVKRHES